MKLKKIYGKIPEPWTITGLYGIAGGVRDSFQAVKEDTRVFYGTGPARGISGSTWYMIYGMSRGFTVIRMEYMAFYGHTAI